MREVSSQPGGSLPDVCRDLKAGTAGDDVIGQIGGYMAWVKDNVAGVENVRGIIVCREVTARTRAAAKMIPDFKVKKAQV